MIEEERREVGLSASEERLPNVYLPSFLPSPTYRPPSTCLPTYPVPNQPHIAHTDTESALSQMKSQEVFYGNHCCRNILH